MSEIKVFTAFSGYDSQCLALEKLGVKYDLVGWSEIDKYAIKAHDLLFPQYKDRNYGDISKIDWSQVPDFDLFTYSSPCQDFSQAGMQRGGEEGSNTRSSLLWECRKAILAKKPKYLLLENVEALVSKKFINLFNKWIAELGEYGYTSYWQVLNAKNYGIPQSRNRVFLVSILRDDKDKYPVYNFPKSFPLPIKLKDILEKEVDKKYYLKKETVEKFLYISDDEDNLPEGVYGLSRNRDEKGNVIKRNFNPYVNCLHTQVGSARENMEVFVAEKNKKIFYKEKEIRPYETFYWNTSLKFASNSTKGGVSSCLKTDNAVAILECEPIIAAMRGRDKKGDGNFEQQLELNKNGVSNTLTTFQKDNLVIEPLKIIEATKKGYAEAKEGDSVDICRISCHQRRGRVGKGVANTLTCTCDMGVVEKCEVEGDVIGYEYRIRKLTPRECFRLMGVNEESINKIQDSKLISEIQQYKLAGNSIVVDVLENIFKKLFIDKKSDYGHKPLF